MWPEAISPPQCEEIVINADPFELQHLSQSGQRLLQRDAWRNEGRPHGRLACDPQLSRQSDPLHLAGRPFGKFADHQHVARDLEVGDAPVGEPANVFRRRRSMGPQHDRRGDVLAQRRVGDGKGYGLRYRRMLQENLFDFLWGKLLRRD